MRRADWVSTLSLLAAAFLWASSFVALKIGFAHYHPAVVIFGRMLVGSVCFLCWPGLFRGIDYRPGDWRALLFMAICEPCLYFVFEMEALTRTTASQAGMVSALLPLMVALAARLVLKERVSRRTTAGFVLAVAGVFWLSAAAEPARDAPNPALGNLLELLAMVCAVGYIVTAKRLTARYSPVFLTALQAFVGSVFFFPFLFLPRTVVPSHVSLAGVLAIVYLGVFVTLAAYALYNFGVSRVPASRAAVFINLIPVFTAFLGWLLLGETFSPQQYAASALVIAGVWLSQDRVHHAERAT